MVYDFNPIYWNGTIFSLDDTWKMSGGWTKYRGANQPIPASFFPPTLTFDKAKAALPDMFHTNRNIIVFSEPARVFTEQRAAGQVEFIPVAVRAPPDIAAKLKFASAYYFVNILGRAQRLLWRDMPTRSIGKEDGTEIFTTISGFHNWRLRERAAGEPLIWRDTPRVVGNKRYTSHTNIFVEDALWRELDANFPNQLNAQQVGE
jgi:hypothetical protein